MKLVVLTALIAVCGAAKLDRTYLPPPSAKTAGGSPEELQVPRNSFNNGLGGLPKGSYKNEFQGVVVDAAEAGVRASEPGDSGLGAPRISYGSTDSKVGAAAFKSQPSRFQAVQRRPERPAFNNQGSFASQNNEAFNPQSQKPQPNNFNYQNSQAQPRDPEKASQDRNAGVLKFENIVGPDNYYYSFQTDNDIKAEENGDTTNGVRAQGGFSYKGDDGQMYSITYVADEGGYQPQGAHLPTPPPIPEAILRALEKNAKDEADGIVDDGSYNAQKYNAGSEYSENVNANGKYQFSKLRGEAEAASSDTFINQSQQKITDDQTDFNKQRPSVSRFSQQNSDLTNSTTNGQTKNSFNRQSSNIDNEQPNQSSDIESTHKIPNRGNKFSSVSSAKVQGNEYLPPDKSTGRPQYDKPQIILQSDKSQITEDINYSYDDYYKFEEPTNLVPLGEQDLQSESRPEKEITSFGRPVSNTNKFTSEIGLGSSNTQKQPFDSIRPSVDRLPSMNFQEEASSSANVNKLNGYLPPNQRNQNRRPLKQSQDFIQFNRQHSGNIDSENMKKPQNPSAFTESPIFEAKPQQTYLQRPKYQEPSQNENNYQSAFQTNLNRASSQTSFGLKPQKSTIMPSIELTTPFESRPSDRNAAKRPLAMSAYNQPSLNAENKFGPIQAPSFSSQTISMSYRQNSQNDNRSRPQGFISSDAQYSASTSKPYYVQQQQGPDDSYIYNHPAIGFSTLKGSKLLNASSSQLNNIKQQTDFSQSSSASLPQGSSRYPKPPMLLQSAPTSSQYKGQFGDQLSDRGTKAPLPPTLAPSQYQTTVNGVTQAAISQFPSPTPTQSSQYNSKVTNQFQQAQAFQQQKEQTDKRIEPIVSTQQYTGEIYEYNKPAQTLPPPDSTTASSALPQGQGQLSLSQSQFGQTKDQKVQRPISQLSLSQSQFGQTKNQKIQRPVSQFGGSKPMFIAEPTYEQSFDENINTQNTQSNINVGASDVIKPFSTQPKIMFRPEGARPQLGTQTKIQSASSLRENIESKDMKKPLSENYELEEESNDEDEPDESPEYVPDLKPSCCRENAGINQADADVPGPTYEETESEKRLFQNSQPMAPFLFPSKLGQMSFLGRENKPSAFVGQAEMFSGPKQPPSFDEETGYHY